MPRALGSAAMRARLSQAGRGVLLSRAKHSGVAMQRFLLCVAALCAATGVAGAKPARCFTRDDGSFPCQFTATARDGSFEISARGKPSYRLNVSEPGIAYGFSTIGGRNVPLPGRYLRSRTDPACWVNDSTRARICAW